jgi:nitrogen regulatory protein PII-like uncharacterized protein
MNTATKITTVKKFVNEIADGYFNEEKNYLMAYYDWANNFSIRSSKDLFSGTFGATKQKASGSIIKGLELNPTDKMSEDDLCEIVYTYIDEEIGNHSPVECLIGYEIEKALEDDTLETLYDLWSEMGKHSLEDMFIENLNNVSPKKFKDFLNKLDTDSYDALDNFLNELADYSAEDSALLMNIVKNKEFMRDYLENDRDETTANCLLRAMINLK